MKPTKTPKRRRQATNITLNPNIKARARAYVEPQGLSLAQWIERLIADALKDPAPSPYDPPALAVIPGGNGAESDPAIGAEAHAKRGHNSRRRKSGVA